MEIIDGKLTGKYLGDIVDGQRSRVPSHCRKEGLHINIAVGDGANDLPMLNLAGLGIAFHNNGERKCFLVDFQSWSGWGLYLLGYHEAY
jgi:phosphoserine phosphatase